MKHDLVSIIGTAVCVAAMGGIFIWNWRNAPAKAPVQPAPAVSTVNQPAGGNAPISSTPAESQEAPTGEEQQGTTLLPKVAAAPITLDTPGEFTVKVDGSGMGVQEVTLYKHTIQTKDADKKNELLTMTSTTRPFMALEVAGTPLYETRRGEQNGNTISTKRMNGAKSFLFEESWTTGKGGDATHDHEIQYTLRITNTSKSAQAVPTMRLSCGILPSFLSTSSNTAFSSSASGSVSYGIPRKEKAKILDYKAITKKMDEERKAECQSTQASWLAVSSKYFLFALRNLEVDGKRAFFPGFAASAPAMDNYSETFHASAYLPELFLQPGESREFKVTGYAGPKNYQRLQQMGGGIESIMGMDVFFFWHFKWMGWICRVLLETLNMIAGWFPPQIAYGLGIILVTLLVKLLFMPLSWKSTRDMRKMSAIKPELDALRQKYKNDTQRLYYEQQKLFKERGVSQLGGCLPMLVQIPVFFCMFNTFRSAIEIRNATFLWVADLSMPDAIFGLPIHPLALLTGLTMYLQQRLTPMPDPNQAKMMNIMSLVFIFFFYNMPAALTLYMTVNQLFSIGQMLLFRRLEKKQIKAA